MESSKAQLRSQLLANETGLPENPAVNTMSGFVANGRSQQHIPMHYQNYNHSMPGSQQYANYSNHDLITPVLESATISGGPSSRKASMNSMSMQRLFRRKGASGGNFDDDAGADIGEISGNDVSFNDITHLRGAGRYNTSAMDNLDTTPIIPVLGMAGSDGAKSLNNVQYRKFMNHQKKLNLAHSARAMSLAGGGEHAHHPDPRSMSFTNAPNSRTNSLGNSMGALSNPNSRAMSLNSNALLRGPPNHAHAFVPGANQQRTHPAMNGQFTHSQNGQPFLQQYNTPGMARAAYQGPHTNPQMQMYGPGAPQHSHLGNPHTMSLRSGVSPPTRDSPQGSKSHSLLGNGATMPWGQENSEQRTQSMTNVAGAQFANPNTYSRPILGVPQYPASQVQPHQNTQVAEPEQNLLPQSKQLRQPSTKEASSDSLMNVVEEEEYEDKQKGSSSSKSSRSSFKLGSSTNTSLPLSVANSDDDHVYKFEKNDNPQISRKSTVKKSDSMRIRKLDLFTTRPETTIDHDYSDQERTGTKHSDYKILSSRHSSSHSDETAGDKSSSESEPMEAAPKTLAPETHKSKPMTAISKTLAPPVYESEDKNSSELRKQIKLRSLTKNTAFSAFRTPSAAAESVSNKSLSVNDTDPSGEAPLHLGQIHHSTTALDQTQDSRNSNKLPREASDSSVVTYTKTSTGTSQNEIELDQSPWHEVATDVRNEDQQRMDCSSSKEPRQNSPGLSDDASPNRHFTSSSATKRESSISRSTSELKLKGYTPSSALLRSNTSESVKLSSGSDMERREKRKSITSITSKSRSLIKRLSLSSSRKTMVDDIEGEEQKSKRRVSSAASMNSMKPLSFTKEELAVMTCNHELQNELQLVTSELANSIKRELALEGQIKSKVGGGENQSRHQSLSSGDLERSKIIADLQSKLNKERKLRFISEEHAILAEHGQSPSALKLDYEKNEIYNQLLEKNELVIQLQDKLDEAVSAKKSQAGTDLVMKFNELLRENAELKTKLTEKETTRGLIHEPGAPPANTDSEEFYHECDQSLIMSLKTQRDELREMITKLTNSRNVELKVAQEKIKILEAKLEKVNSINSKLSKRVEKSSHTNGTARFASGQGGKLQGFSIVSPTKKLFDN